MSTYPVVSVTIEETAQLIRELAAGTNPSFLQALRAAGISPRMNLLCNLGYALALKQLGNSPLPHRAELEALLSSAKRTDGSGRAAWGMMRSHIDTLYSIDDFWFGYGAHWQQAAQMIGETLDEQRAWRCRLNSLIRGMGFKCLSWAAFIYSPETCQLLTLDSWHAKRLGVDGALLMRDSESSHSLYERMEARTIDEVSELFPGYPATVGAACLWFNIRGKGYESHAGLNCRLQEYDLAAD